MQVDFTHLAAFPFNEPYFVDQILQQYVRFEPYLRQALERFLVSLNHQIEGNRFFQIAIYNLPKVDKVRDLKTANLGKIMSIEGTVTRTTEVKPELSIGTFKCKMCETLTDGIEQQFKFTKPIKCKAQNCSNALEFELVTKESVF